MQVYTGTFNKDTLLNCTNCGIALSSEEDYKMHYKSEFHRYNIKRKVLGLKPATQEQFATKKGEVQSEEVKQNKGFECTQCRYGASYSEKHSLTKECTSSTCSRKNMEKPADSQRPSLRKKIREPRGRWCLSYACSVRVS